MYSELLALTGDGDGVQVCVASPVTILSADSRLGIGGFEEVPSKGFMYVFLS